MRRKRGWSQQVTLALWRHRALRGSVTKGRACDQRDRDVTSYWPRGMQSFGERKRPNLTQATAKEKRPRVHSTLPGEHKEGNQHSWTLIVTSLASGVWCSRVGILFASLMKWPLIGLLLDRANISFCFKSWFTSSPSQWGYPDYSKSSPSYSQLQDFNLAFPVLPFPFPQDLLSLTKLNELVITNIVYRLLCIPTHHIH